MSIIFFRILSPFIVLARLRHRALFFYGLTIGLVCLFYLEIYQLIPAQVLSLVQELDLPSQTALWLTVGLRAVFTLALIPVLVTVSAISVSESRKISSPQHYPLYRRLLPALADTIQTSTLVLRSSLYILVAPLAMLALYNHYVAETPYETARHLYVALCLIICGVGYFRALPFFLSPAISATLELRPTPAIELAITHYRKQSLEFSLLLIVGGALCWSSFHFSEVIAQKLGLSEVQALFILMVFSVWYALSTISDAIIDGYRRVELE